jgi:hypothetical protein
MVRGMREVGQKPSTDYPLLYCSSWGGEGQENREYLETVLSYFSRGTDKVDEEDMSRAEGAR